MNTLNAPLANNTDAQLLEEIEKLQQIQKTHRSTSPAWIAASSLLEPLFAEMARRQGGNNENRTL